MNSYAGSPKHFFKIINSNGSSLNRVSMNLDNPIHNKIYKEKTLEEEEFHIVRTHLINFYEMNKSYIKIEESNDELLPKIKPEPYGDFSGHVSKLHCEKLFTDPLDDSSQVILLKSENNKFFVLKRFVIDMNQSILINEIMDDEKLDNFVRGHFTEYCLSKLFSCSPHSVNVIGFKIVKIGKINSLASELLIEYAGIGLDMVKDKDKSPRKIFIWVEQMLNALNYLECYKIEHNDIKIQNFLIDDYEEGKKDGIIKLIDFDVGANLSITKSPNKSSGMQSYTDIFISPEKFQILYPHSDKLSALERNESQIISDKIVDINPWRSHIYSLGFVILYLLGFFKAKSINVKEFDKKYKLRKQDHKNLIDEVNEFIGKSIKNLKKKEEIATVKLLHEIIKICLEFNNEDRLDANELLDLLKIAKNNKLTDLEPIATKFKRARKKTVDDLENELQKTKEDIFNCLKQCQNRISISIPIPIPNPLNNVSPLSALEEFGKNVEEKIRELDIKITNQQQIIQELNYELHSKGSQNYVKNFQVKMKMPNMEGLYNGQIYNNYPDGMGNITFANQAKYIGIFNEGTIDGFGKIYDSNGDIYMGCFNQGLFSDYGMMIYNDLDKSKSNKQVYIGNWENGKRNGKGILYLNNKGSTYYGDWKDDKKEGIGIITTEQHYAKIGLFGNDEILNWLEGFHLPISNEKAKA